MDTINPLCTKELRMKEKAKHRMMKHSIIRFYKAYGVTQTTFEEDTAGRLVYRADRKLHQTLYFKSSKNAGLRNCGFLAAAGVLHQEVQT